MKFVSTLLLTLFCAFLLTQTACTGGWQVHEDCPLEQAGDDHDEACHSDLCRLSYNSPVKSKMDEPAPVHFIGAGPAVDIQPVDSIGHLAGADPQTGSTTPRPTGNFPLLI